MSLKYLEKRKLDLKELKERAWTCGEMVKSSNFNAVWGDFLHQSLNFNNLGKFHMKGICYYHNMRNRLTIAGFLFFVSFCLLIFRDLEDDVRGQCILTLISISIIFPDYLPSVIIIKHRTHKDKFARIYLLKIHKPLNEILLSLGMILNLKMLSSCL